MTLPAGTLLGSFEVLGLLGAGGMGEVYRARDGRLGREVAVKVLGAEFLAAPEHLRRFIGEARAASTLNHRNIITIYEVGQAGGQPFLAMELVDGKTLRQIAAGGLLPQRRALDVMVQVADGLSAAHEASLVHRDLKPENVMVARDGTVKILDFGLAKPFGAAASGELAAQLAKTTTGIVVGTASYMSPEQARGRPVDFRSDQFCLGLILYELLTGRKAFDKASAVQTLTAIIEEEPEPLERLNPRLPAPLVWIVDRCLAKEPEERYAATRDLARELKQVRDNLGRLTEGLPRPSLSATSSARVESAATIRTAAATAPHGATVQVPAAAPEARRPHASRVLAAALGALALLGGGAGVGWWLRDRTADAPSVWNGELVLGNATQVLASRVSPDGETLAFVTPAGGTSQVAVMKPASGDWSVLTNRHDSGSVYRVAWSKDGTRIYFDRLTDVPHGIFSVPAVGGGERLVLEDAQSPELLPDGSLLVVRTSAQGELRIHRFTPDTGLVSPLGPPIVAESAGLSVRATPDGRFALFWGRLAGEGAASRPRQLHLLDLASGKVRPVTSELPVAPPYAVAADGRLLATVALGDLFRLVSVSLDGSDVRGLFTVTTRPTSVSMGPDGTYFVCLSESTLEVLRFPVAGGVPERLGFARGTLSSPASLPDGRVLLPGLVAGRRRLLVRSASGETRPVVDTSDQTAPPVVTLGGRAVFLAGPPGKPSSLVLASIDDGRILRRYPGTEGAAPQDLAASPDQKTVYYPDRGALWAIDVEGNAPPRRLVAGHGVAAFPNGLELLVQRNGMNGVDLFRVPVTGGRELRIPLQGDLRLAPAPLSGRAVGPDEKVAVTVASRSSWRWGPGLLDPATGAVAQIPIAYDGDVQSVGWDAGGNLLGLGVTLRTELWRFHERR